MSEQEAVAPEATTDAVQPEQVSAPEAAESTDGQVDSQPAEDQGATPESEEVSKSKARRERRKAEIQRLRDDERKARENADEVTKRLDAIKNAAQSQQPPKDTEFQDYNDYLIAAAAYQASAQLDQRETRNLEQEATAARERAEAIQQQTAQERAHSWKEQADDARTRYADFDQVALSESTPITPPMAQVIQSSDMGADVAYYLGTHRAEAAQIAQLEPLDMARALGAIEARVSLPKPRTHSQAPDPIKPVTPKGTASKDPEKMSMAEYKAWAAGGYK